MKENITNATQNQNAIVQRTDIGCFERIILIENLIAYIHIRLITILYLYSSFCTQQLAWHIWPTKKHTHDFNAIAPVLPHIVRHCDRDSLCSQIPCIFSLNGSLFVLLSIQAKWRVQAERVKNINEKLKQVNWIRHLIPKKDFLPKTGSIIIFWKFGRFCPIIDFDSNIA